MTENTEYLGLEQRCITPGHWLIEGYHVLRRGYRSWGRSTVEWTIIRPPLDLDAVPVHMTKTLAAAREWIHANR